MNKVNYEGITSINWMDVQAVEIVPGIFERKLWSNGSGQTACVLEFKPEAKYPGIDAHLSGPEQLYVISGVFNDGERDYREGSFINNPAAAKTECNT